MPTVSVIVPNFNHALFLKQRIESILNQTYQDFELILLDDCSTDNSRDVLASYADNQHVSQIVFNDRNSGSTFKQWEKGLNLAKGRYVWIAESDDYASPFFLEKTLSVFEETQEAVLVFTGSQMVDENGEELEKDWDYFSTDTPEKTIYQPSLFLQKILGHNFVYNASMVVFRRDCYKRVDSDFKSFRYCGDWFFWVDIGKQGMVVGINEKLNYFRQHLNKVSVRSEKEGLSFSEGGRVQLHIMDILQLTPFQRMVIRGKEWTNLKNSAKSNPLLLRTVPTNLPELFNNRLLSILCYKLEKHFHVSKWTWMRL